MKFRSALLRTAAPPVKQDAELLEAAGEFARYLKNKPEGRWADIQGPEMDLPNPNWPGSKAPKAYVGVRDWGNWVVPPDAEGNTEDYDWKVMSEESSKKLTAYIKQFKADAKARWPRLKFDIEGGEKSWLSIYVTRMKAAPVKKAPAPAPTTPPVAPS